MGATIADAVADAVGRFQIAGVEDPAGDAWRLVDEASRRTTGDGPGPGDEICPAVAGVLADWINQRARRRPVSQIISRRLFFESAFFVNSEVLDPRPESELLVEAGLRFDPRSILDLGTGSGCLLLSLLLRLPKAAGVGVDISHSALQVAQLNCRTLELCGRAKLVYSDWYSEIEGRFDLIVANPPYLSEQDYRNAPAELAIWEPPCALTPGGGGLAAYERIAGGASCHLERNGRLVLEIGSGQFKGVAKILRRHSIQVEDVLDDLECRPRALICRLQ